jgi:hypothetical protein
VPVGQMRLLTAQREQRNVTGARYPLRIVNPRPSGKRVDEVPYPLDVWPIAVCMTGKCSRRPAFQTGKPAQRNSAMTLENASACLSWMIR